MSSFDTGSTESQAPSSVLTAGTGASIDDESEQSWTTLKAQAKAINDQYTGFSNGKGGFNAGFFDGLVLGEWNTFGIYSHLNDAGITNEPENAKGRLAQTSTDEYERARELARTFEAIKDSNSFRNKIEIDEVSSKVPEKGSWNGSIKYKLLKSLIDEKPRG